MGKSLARAIAWIFLAAGCVMVGAILSASAAAFGLTSFGGDNRGEWYAVVAPVGLALSLLAAVPSFLYLRKTISGSRLIIFTGAVVLASLVFYTWRFMAFAA
jgi:hypothetical protein